MRKRNGSFKITESKYASSVQRLIYLAETNFLICKGIYEKFEMGKSKVNTFFLLTANNAFNEAVITLHTLLCSAKSEELTIRPLLETIIQREKRAILNLSVSAKKENLLIKRITEDYPYPDYFSYDFLFENDTRLIGDILADIREKKRKTGLNDLENLKKEFEEASFHKIRHQSAAHKNKLLDNPAGAIDSSIKEDLLEGLGNIVKKLRIQSYFWFSYELKNPNAQAVKDLERLLTGDTLGSG